jgi:hypothetical protein
MRWRLFAALSVAISCTIAACGSDDTTGGTPLDGGKEDGTSGTDGSSSQPETSIPGTDSSGGDDTGTGSDTSTTDGMTGDTGTADGGGDTSTTDTSTSDTSTTDASSSDAADTAPCNALTQLGSPVSQMYAYYTGPYPFVAEGGTIQNGTYVMTSFLVYQSDAATSGATGRPAESITLVVNNGTIQVVDTRSDAAVTHNTLDFTIATDASAELLADGGALFMTDASPNIVSLNEVCGGNGSDIQLFSASPTSFYFLDVGNGEFMLFTMTDAG